jgi:AraC-like DNA-binding protein
MTYPEIRHLTFSHPGIDIPTSFPFRIHLFSVGAHFSAHRHEFLELSFIVEGEGYQVINGVHHPIQPGTLFFLLPYQVHEMFVASKPFRMYNCMFDMNLLFLSSTCTPSLDQLLYVVDDLSPSVTPDTEEVAKIETLFAEMLHEYRSDNAWRNAYIQLKLLDVLIRFDRLRRQVQHASPSNRSGTPSIWTIIRHVHLHFQEPLSLSSLAAHNQVSVSYLSEAFKRYTGMNFVHFLQEVRLRHACGLLVSAEMSETDIAAEAGFGTYRSFLRTFRDMKHMTPGEYRRLYRTE